MKLKTFLSTVVISAAVLYFAKSDEKKQSVMDCVAVLNKAIQEFSTCDIKSMSIGELSSRFNMFVEAESELAEMVADCANRKELFTSMNQMELSISFGALSTQHTMIKAHLRSILGEMRQRYA